MSTVTTKDGVDIFYKNIAQRRVVVDGEAGRIVNAAPAVEGVRIWF